MHIFVYCSKTNTERYLFYLLNQQKKQKQVNLSKKHLRNINAISSRINAKIAVEVIAPFEVNVKLSAPLNLTGLLESLVTRKQAWIPPFFILEFDSEQIKLHPWKFTRAETRYFLSHPSYLNVLSNAKNFIACLLSRWL